ncbi:MAG: VOC family protein [Candidatus Pacebacteria bacterium]|nr:VOC family protein [Candidatus Paceibacterota bacterium]
MSKYPVVHFEMPYNDKARVAQFYQSAFGWQMNQLGPEMGEYVLANTAETDANQMVKTPGTINGGFFPQGTSPEAAVSVVISTENLEDSINQVKSAGGTINMEPMEIPGIGRYVSFTDTEGNRVGMLQPTNK